MSPQLLAGVGRTNITPPVGVDLWGTSRRAGPSIGIHQDLFATCLVLSTEDERFAMVSCDLAAIPNPTSDELRQRIGDVIGTGADHVLLGCTHTHLGPHTSPAIPKTGGDQTCLREVERTYLASLGYYLEGAARLASDSLRPARLAAGHGRADVSVNRRELFEDGQVVLGRNYDGPRDAAVQVLRVDTEDSVPLAALVNYACHPVTLGTDYRLISPDFPGSARRVIEELTGATSLYLTGAAGNIMPLRSLHPDHSMAELVGRQIGCEATRVFLDLNPQPTETRVTFQPSVSKLRVYEEVPIQRPPITHFKVSTRQLDLDLQPLPSLAEAERLLEEKRDRVLHMRANGESAELLNVAIFYELWARNLVKTLQAGTATRTVRAEIQAIRLDDIALIAIPGEPFVEIGLAVKTRSPFKRTFFIGYANGAIGYIPMRADYALGGYEVEEGYKAYGFPSALAPGTAEQITGTCLDLLQELANSEAVNQRPMEGQSPRTEG